MRLSRQKFFDFINNKIKAETADADKYEAYKIKRGYLPIFRCEICKRIFRRDFAIIIYVRRKGTLWSNKHEYYFCRECAEKINNGEIT